MKYPKIVLTYFNIEGAAEPTRLALALAGIEYEDKRVQFSEWATMKPTTPYGQLPLLTVDDGAFQTQSNAMLRYVASLNAGNGLYPKENLYEIEECIGLLDDMKNSWSPNLYMSMRPAKFGYPADYAKTEEGKEKLKSMRQAWIKDELPIYLGHLMAKIEKNGGKWLASSDKPTIADCYAVPALRNYTRGHIDHVDSSCLDSYKPIVDYVKRFCELEGIKGRYTDGLH